MKKQAGSAKSVELSQRSQRGVNAATNPGNLNSVSFNSRPQCYVF